MDYIKQTENIFDYLKFNCDFDELEKLIHLKRDFNNDLNLIGCFIKDYLILNHKESNFEDENLYSEFVLYFEQNIENKKEIINNIKKFSKYYLMIVFEQCEDVQILSIISTINLCYCMECYPLIMKILDDYYEKRTDNNSTIRMLQSLSSAVLNKFENINDYNIDFYNVMIDNKGCIYSKDKLCERVAL